MATVAPLTLISAAPGASPPCAARKFIAGLPMKPATNFVAGFS